MYSPLSRNAVGGDSRYPIAAGDFKWILHVTVQQG